MIVGYFMALGFGILTTNGHEYTLMNGKGFLTTDNTDITDWEKGEKD
jgi:hypothetical protein